jgi:hypothetical protein
MPMMASEAKHKWIGFNFTEPVAARLEKHAQTDSLIKIKPFKSEWVQTCVYSDYS